MTRLHKGKQTGGAVSPAERGKKMLNKEIYRAGDQQFRELADRNRWDELTEREFDEMMEQMADKAYYCDNLEIETDALGYYVIAEAVSIEAANEYLKFRGVA